MKRLAAIPIVTFVLLLVGMSVASAQQTHTVVRGDTLWALSQRYHTTVQALATTNGIPNPNLIFPGQVLVLEGPGTTPAPLRFIATSPSHPRWVSPAPAAPAAPLGGVWACIRQHESGGNYAEDTGNGYYGAYQFALSTWRSLGGVGYPDDASPAVQDAMAQKLQAEAGWSPWPNTSRMCGV